MTNHPTPVRRWFGRFAKTSLTSILAIVLVMLAVPAIGVALNSGPKSLTVAEVAAAAGELGPQYTHRVPPYDGQSPKPKAKPAPKPKKPATKPDRRPNIVMVLTDDMRLDDLRWMPKTRNLLGTRGATFTNAISPHPLCCPARAEILSGQFGQNNGVRNNGGPHGGYHAMDTTNTLATWLHGSGYNTAFIGKYLNRYQARHGHEPGWTRWKALVKHNLRYRQYQFYGSKYVANGYVTDAIADHTDAAIRAFHRSKKPFLIMANHVAPHDWQDGKVVRPPVPAKRHARAYSKSRPPSFSNPSFNEADITDKPADVRHLRPVKRTRVAALHRARIQSLASVDEAVARLVKTLRSTGELANTYIVFTSDNGYSLGEHRMMNKNRIIAENLRIPLLIRGPKFRPGSRPSGPASLVDLAPTFADLAKVTPGRRVDGRSLVSGRTPRNTTLVQTGTKFTKPGPNAQWLYRGVVTGRYTYAYQPRNPKVRLLYDHAYDPHEMTNVAEKPAYARIRAELHRRTKILSTCNGPASCNRMWKQLPKPVNAARLFKRR